MPTQPYAVARKDSEDHPGAFRFIRGRQIAKNWNAPPRFQDGSEDQRLGFRLRFSRQSVYAEVECFSKMHKTNSIVMQAPKMSIFETAANLELWPKILPHYRYIRYLERSPNRNVVVMAARRSGIPIKWTSEVIIDRERVEIHFHHLKAFTKHMHVVWAFEEKPNGVLVTILHDLKFRVNILAPLADKIIGNFFIGNIANKTLRCMKSYLEGRTNTVII